MSTSLHESTPGPSDVKTEEVHDGPSLDIKHAASSSAGQMRSRITVVCAECKRLKLKCDRRIPCSSCQKRDCVSRCVYSQAAAEKIDVQSLHNRVLVLEAALAQIRINPAFGQSLVSSVFPPQFMQPNGAASSSPSLYNGLPSNDRSLLATSKSGSSLSIPLDDVASVWLADLDMDLDGLMSGRTSGDSSSAPGLTLTPSADSDVNIDPSTHWPSLTPYYLDFPPPSGSSAPADQLHVTPALCMLLPRSPALRARLLVALERTLLIHPCLDWSYLRNRMESLFTWADAAMNGPVPVHMPPPTISFFSLAAAGLALAAYVMAAESDASPVDLKEADPAALMALSNHALSVFEIGNMYDLDSVTAMLFQILYLLHDRNGRSVKDTAFPRIGKLVNVARIMGLQTDPDEYPGTFSLFESEMRRRVWWDIYYYDVFVSDIVGQAPLIADNQYTTRMPMALDDERFTPTSTTMPYAAQDSTSTSAYLVQKLRLAQLFKRIKKDVYRDPMDTSTEPNISHAEAMEGDVLQWLAELPTSFRLRLDPAASNTKPLVQTEVPPILVAQRCELAIVAHRLILKLYHSFIRHPQQARSTTPPHQALLGTANAAHMIIGAAQLLHSTAVHARPASFLFYSFARGVFDASVICAHAVIMTPHAIWARTAQEDVEAGLVLLRAVSSSRPSSVEGDVWEGVKVVEGMLGKVISSRTLSTDAPDGSAPARNLKRKREDPKIEAHQSTFRLPFVGAEVSVEGTYANPPPNRRPHPTINTSLTSSSTQPPSSLPTATSAPAITTPASHKPCASRNSSDKSDSKGRKHPSVGMRMRDAKPEKKASVHVPDSELMPAPSYPQLHSQSMPDLMSRQSSIEHMQPLAPDPYAPPSTNLTMDPMPYATAQPASVTSSGYYLPPDAYPPSFALPVADDSPHHSSDGGHTGSSPYSSVPQTQHTSADLSYSTQPSPANYTPSSAQQYYMPYSASDPSAAKYHPRPHDGVSASMAQRKQDYYPSGLIQSDMFLPAPVDEHASPASWQVDSRGVTPAAEYWSGTPTYNYPQHTHERRWP